MILVALSAVILPMVLLGVLNLPATKGMSISAIVVMILGATFWKMDTKILVASIFQAIHKSLPIIWILFGALVMLKTLEHTGAITRINIGFEKLSSDMRVQTILIAYLFGGLIEGVSGFGTPAMVTAPLMIALGFSPMASVTLALVADSTPAAFGAVGTPLTVGLSNVNDAPSFLNTVGQSLTRIDLFAGSLMPTILIFLLIFLFSSNKQNRFKNWLEFVPWTLLLGILYSVTALLSAAFVGYEFVSILAPFVTIIIAIVSIRFKLLIPKSSFATPWTMKQKSDTAEETSDMSLIKAWSPYIIVVVMLLLSRVIEPLKVFLTTFLNLSWKNIFGFKGLNSDWEFLYSPGTLLTIAVILGLLIQVRSIKSFVPTGIKVIKSMKSTAIALIVTLVMVQVFTNSNYNSADLESMPMYIANFISKYFSAGWIFIAPFLGALGSFVTGSTTVSTLTFGQIQSDIASNAHISQQVVLSAQLIGAAAGNMICVHNIVAVSSLVGLNGQEGNILRKTLAPAFLYCLLVGIVGFIFILIF
ncbi:L-lactate permease [Companilactobacillus jidongensis]|uniref:L-lactate permease n=1 Tax=Companilactobacillus jidongensis TaxID=2486006 RepID=UPI000F79399B|nr:L-lactate permease [Companilactobacillus jidongensis]